MDTKREEDEYVEFGWIATKDLNPHPDNAREHTEEQIEDIAKSIKNLDWGRPLIISKDNYILAGHGAFLAATDILNLMSVPFRRVKYLHDSPEAIAIMDSDNRLAELSSWNYGKLETHFETLKAEHFDVTLTGFEDISIEQINNKVNSTNSEFDPEKEWEGMPEFEQEDKSGVQQIVVHFETREDVEEFAELVQQNITEKTKYIWYPKLEKNNLRDHIYVESEEDMEI